MEIEEYGMLITGGGLIVLLTYEIVRLTILLGWI